MSLVSCGLWVVKRIRNIICLRGRRSIFYDGNVYPAPTTFDPERFLKDGKLDRSIRDPEERIFGSGRRYAQPTHVSVTFPPQR